MTSLGTPHYIAPEVWNEILYDDENDKSLASYDHKVDEWSIGVLIFKLLVGDFPFDGNSLLELRHKIDTNIVEYNRISDEKLRTMCQRFLVSDYN